MRSVPANTLAILQNAPEEGISVRDFVYIETVQGAIGFGFYSDVEPSVTVPVIDGESGAVVNRQYYGAGALRGIGDIRLTVGLNVYNVTVELSNIHPEVVEMLRGYDIRNARIEIHRGIIDPATGQLADPPMLHFIGTVNTVPTTRGASKESGLIRVVATSITNELTRTNPSKFSDATISRRSGDRLLRYVDIMGDVPLRWGAEGDQTAASGGKSNKNNALVTAVKEFLGKVHS